MSQIETCRNGHSRVDLYNTTPKGQRYCRDCHTIRKGAWTVKAGRVVDSKYIGVYEENVQETITKLEKRIEILQKKLDKQKARLEKGEAVE